MTPPSLPCMVSARWIAIVPPRLCPISTGRSMCRCWINAVIAASAVASGAGPAGGMPSKPGSVTTYTTWFFAKRSAVASQAHAPLDRPGMKMRGTPLSLRFETLRPDSSNVGDGSEGPVAHAASSADVRARREIKRLMRGLSVEGWMTMESHHRPIGACHARRSRDGCRHARNAPSNSVRLQLESALFRIVDAHVVEATQ